MTCRYCEKPIVGVSVIVHAYWKAQQVLPNGRTGNPPHYSHPECQKEGFAAEVLECQTIDADCNDCRHYKRGQRIGNDIFDGHCLKLDKPTVAQPNKWTGHPCFEHRKLAIK